MLVSSAPRRFHRFGVAGHCAFADAGDRASARAGRTEFPRRTGFGGGCSRQERSRAVRRGRDLLMKALKQGFRRSVNTAGSCAPHRGRDAPGRSPARHAFGFGVLPTKQAAGLRRAALPAASQAE